MIVVKKQNQRVGTTCKVINLKNN